MVVQQSSRSKAWSTVEGRVESLGKDVRKHLDEVSKQASAEREAVEQSIRSLLSALDDGFGAAAKTVRDPELRKDLSKVAVAVREAVLVTFGGAGSNVRKRLAGPAIKREGTAATKPTAAKRTTAKTTTAKRGAQPAKARAAASTAKAAKAKAH